MVSSLPVVAWLTRPQLDAVERAVGEALFGGIPGGTGTVRRVLDEAKLRDQEVAAAEGAAPIATRQRVEGVDGSGGAGAVAPFDARRPA